MGNPDGWVHVLTDAEIAEVDAALEHVMKLGIDVVDITAENFSLPLLAPRLRALSADLVAGRGLALFRGLPVERYDAWRVCAAFYGMGSHLGWPCPQNARGHVLGHVKDLGNDPDDPATRIYTTCAAQPFHTDSADIVGLLCIADSASGGESQVVSSVAVWNELVNTRPDLARELTRPFNVDRKGEVPPGKKPTYLMPVFHVHAGEGGADTATEGVSVAGGREVTRDERKSGDEEDSGAFDAAGMTAAGPPPLLLSGIYDRNFITSAQKRFTEADGVPRLTPLQIEALDALDTLCGDDRFRLDMRLEPGDIQWLHNHTTLHARSAYTDGGPEPSRRHLLRLWITPPNARPLPAIFAERFGTTEVGPERGGIRVEGQTPYCALEPAG